MIVDHPHVLGFRRSCHHRWVIRRRGTVPSTPLLVACGALAGGLAGFGLWLGLDFGLAPRTTVVSDVAVGVCFAATGIVAWRLRPRSRTGPWMLLFGLAVLLRGPNGFLLPTDLPGRGLIVLVGVPAYALEFAIAVHLFLGYPTGRLPGRAERRLVAIAFPLACVTAALMLVTWTPAPFCGNGCGRSPVQLVASVPLFLGVRSVLIFVWVGVAAALVTLLIRRLVRASPRQRRALRLMMAAAGLTALFDVLEQLNNVAIQQGHGAAGGAAFLSYVAQWASVIALPVAFLAGLLRERLAFASVAELVGRLEQVTADTVEAELGRTLRDPTLRVAFRTDSGWLDVAGHPYEPPTDGSRALTALGDPPVAVLVHDPALSEDSELLDAAAAAARLALDNARLQAEVRAQLAEVQASRQRIAAAADTERQRLERDLHDGAQQRLLGVGLSLGVLRSSLGSADRDLIDELERELRTAIGELRNLAQGIRPAVLTDQGLEPALAGLARRAGVTVTLDLQLTRRLDPVIEATAYYVVSEALQNVLKHATDARVQVRAVHQAYRLNIDVRDDGPGGASILSGTGLRGLADRVEAVGGRFQVDSPPGRGTHLRAELPCA